MTTPGMTAGPVPGDGPGQGGRLAIRRALVSVHDKAGLAELARGLHDVGIEIVSTGSTAAAVIAAGLPVTRVEDLTGFPECLGRKRPFERSPSCSLPVFSGFTRPVVTSSFG